MIPSTIAVFADGWGGSAGVWLVLRPRTFQVLIGLTLLSYAVNLFIFSVGSLAVDGELAGVIIAGFIHLELDVGAGDESPLGDVEVVEPQAHELALGIGAQFEVAAVEVHPSAINPFLGIVR